jgi:hypothetical protein
MLKEEVFERAAEEYGTSIGVAKIFKSQPLADVKGDFDKKEYKEYEKTLTINYIITDCIEMGIYKELQKKLYELRVIRKTTIQDELKLYRKAFKEITQDLDYIDEY